MALLIAKTTAKATDCPKSLEEVFLIFLYLVNDRVCA